MIVGWNGGGIVDRRISGLSFFANVCKNTYSPSGVQQFVPRDYEQRIGNFLALLQDLHRQRNFTRFVVGDETGVRMEDLPVRCALFPVKHFFKWFLFTAPWKRKVQRVSRFAALAKNARCLRSGCGRPLRSKATPGCVVLGERTGKNLLFFDRLQRRRSPCWSSKGRPRAKSRRKSRQQLVTGETRPQLQMAG